MRIRISFDGADTKEVRECAAALARIGKRSTMTVGCDGPEKWNGETPNLNPNEFAAVACALIKYNGQPVADVLDELRKAAS